MGKKSYSNIGDDIKNIVQDALESTDFKQLNKNITETVNRALEEARKSSDQWQKQGKTRVSNKKKADLDQMAYTDYETVEIDEAAKSSYYDRQQRRDTRKNRKKNLIARSPAGRVSGILMQIFGNLGLVMTMMMLLGAYFMSEIMAGSIFLIPLAAVFTALIIRGTGLRNRFKRFRQYVERLNGRSFCKISELAEPVQRSNKYVVKDLRKMINALMFPRGRIDKTETYLFLDDESYQAHMQLEEGKRLKEAEDFKKEQKKEVINPEEKAVNEVISEGAAIILEIREANAEIEEKEISVKLERLEKVISKIFEYVEKNPQEVLEIRKFMGYYLPTTLKLVRVYRDLDREAIQGANIRSTKKEIEETLDTINHAFENLLDGFYQDTAMDIASDISVLNTILAQEGLTKKDFKQGDQNGQ
ncbi:5-bromo-4-chloroindolyl phosphate hydrolysis family protein [Eubacteriaceae bacterium ES3]|nr:5-bromo-4-chloroindolyl phosphate hydrolysis family protein [Eubacteriaceae bacterium ES3]